MKFLQLAKYFNRQERVSLWRILGCSILMGLLELLTVTSITPFFLIISKPEMIHSNRYFAQFSQFFNIASVNHLMMVFGLLVFALLLATNIFSMFTHGVISRFGYNYGSRLSSNILNRYLNRPYFFHLQNNSASLCKNAIDEVNRFVTGFLINGLNSVSKIAVIFAQFMLLFIIDYKLALVLVFSVTLFYFFAFAKIKKRLSEAGKTLSIAYEKRYQAAREALGAIKEIQLLGRTQAFTDWFESYSSKYAKAEALNYVAPFASRYMIDTFAFGGMICIAIYIIGTKGVVNDVLPTLGLYTIAGYRLIPAAQQLFSGGTLARYHASAYKIIEQELSFDVPDRAAIIEVPLSFSNGLVLKGVSVLYGEKTILNKLNLSIRKSTTVGIVGETGAGKTTLVDLMMGLIEPTEGELLIDNNPLNATNRSSWQAHIGYVPQNIFLIDDTLIKNIALGISDSEIDFEKVKRASKMANLDEFVLDSLPLGYQTFIGEGGIRLSGGQRQRIGIARALYHDPEVLVFDEATSSLDSQTESVILDAINKLSHKKTIIMIAHRLNTVKQCDEIFVLSLGKLVSRGTYDELMLSSPSFQKIAKVATS